MIVKQNSLVEGKKKVENMNTQKSALNRLLAIVEGDMGNYPMLRYLIQNHRDDNYEKLAFYDGLLKYRENHFLVQAQRIAFAISLFMVINVASPFGLPYSGEFGLAITKIGCGIFGLCILAWFSLTEIRNSLNCVNKLLPRFLKNLEIFEDHFGYIVNQASSGDSKDNWTEYGDITVMLKNIIEQILVNKYRSVILNERTLDFLDSRKPFNNDGIELYNAIVTHLFQIKRSFWCLHRELILYGLTEKSPDRFRELAEGYQDRSDSGDSLRESMGD